MTPIISSEIKNNSIANNLEFKSFNDFIIYYYNIVKNTPSSTPKKELPTISTFHFNNNHRKKENSTCFSMLGIDVEKFESIEKGDQFASFVRHLDFDLLFLESPSSRENENNQKYRIYVPLDRIYYFNDEFLVNNFKDFYKENIKKIFNDNEELIKYIDMSCGEASRMMYVPNSSRKSTLYRTKKTHRYIATSFVPPPKIVKKDPPNISLTVIGNIQTTLSMMSPDTRIKKIKPLLHEKNCEHLFDFFCKMFNIDSSTISATIEHEEKQFCRNYALKAIKNFKPEKGNNHNRLLPLIGLVTTITSDSDVLTQLEQLFWSIPSDKNKETRKKELQGMFNHWKTNKFEVNIKFQETINKIRSQLR